MVRQAHHERLNKASPRAGSGKNQQADWRKYYVHINKKCVLTNEQHYIVIDDNAGEDDAVDAVEKAAVAGQGITGVFNTHIALK